MVEEIKIERELYSPTMRFLYVSFIAKLRDLSALSNQQIFASETASSPAFEGGQWTRPDVSALVLGRGEYIPHWHADLHTFEIKTASGLNETSAHEASAHGRFGNYAWLVFQTVNKAPITSPNTRKVIRLASHLGVGVIHFEDPNDPHKWFIELWPRRTGTDPSAADAFIAERFSNEQRNQIRQNLNALGWVGD